MTIETILLVCSLLMNFCVLIIQSGIKNAFAKSLETHRDELSRITTQNNFRFSHVFIKTESVIATIYKMLIELKDVSEGVNSGNVLTREEKFGVFLEKGQAFLKFYEPNKLYLPKATAIKTRDLFYTLQEAVTNWNTAVQISSSPAADLEQRTHYFEKYHATAKEIPAMLEIIHSDFQNILGFPPEEKKS